jgi:cytochrome c oxidase subunit 1
MAQVAVRAPAQVGSRPRPQRRPMAPPLRALLWAGVAFVVFNGLTLAVDPSQQSPYMSEVSFTVAWVAATFAFLLGIGGYEAVVLPMFGLEERWRPFPGWRRYFAYHTDHKVVGLQYMAMSAGGFLIAGLVAMLMRYELMHPYLTIFGTPMSYLNAVGIHGGIMMFSFATVFMVGGLGNYLVPLMLGTNRTAFPKLSGLSVWLVPIGILTIALSPLLGYWTTGWRGYQPLAGSDPSGIVMYYLGVWALTMSSFMVAMNLTVTILFHRAPGLTWNRLPMFVWGILTVSLLNIIWLPEIQATFLLNLLERLVPMNIFNVYGSTSAYMDLFWLFGHPEVYIIVVPALAVWNEILPVMAKKSLFARPVAVLGLVFVMLLSGLVWAHHMFTNVRDTEQLPFSFFTEMISIPTGFAYLAALGTLWRSRLRITTPTLLILMSMFNFLIGGLTGLFVADVPINFQLHNTFFVVGHFHYTIIGGMVFSSFAAMFYWLPKITGRMYSEFWGKLGAIWIFLAFNATFLNFFVLGLRGMNRWVPVYPPYLGGENFFTSIAAFVLGAGFLFNAGHILWAWVRGPKAEENPWGARTLEWYTASPPPETNFARPPLVAAGFYTFGDDVPAPVWQGPAASVTASD